MRLSAWLCFTLFVSGAYGWKVLAMHDSAIPFTPQSLHWVQGEDHESPAAAVQAYGLPMQSKVSPGYVEEMRLPYPLSLNLLVVGNDAYSRQWLLAHREALQNFHGLGLVAKVETVDQLATLEMLAGMPLMAANVDSLMAFIHQEHYPLVIEKGRVWQ
ncbi:PFL_4695 family integrating conjugative element protein [Legionella fairfieldensis]|uniref:PFL_4695 family integrating conjugative element protein n=1 Tax=Legionella fairfieldensis TaxID=45064 RepID=UPI00048EA232|nr:integrating conjugative element protein [Legionella fairfieldensis]